MIRRNLLIALCLLFFASCMTFYQRNAVFHQYFASHDYAKANETLDKNKYIQKDKNKLLYLLDKGVTLQMMGQYVESNKILEEAYIFVDDFQHSVGRDALSLVTNDMMRNYAGEDFERVYIHYYKAINYIMLDQLEEAMVEAKRINIKLNEINDKYKGENKYKRDAFAHVLMGLLYEAFGDENNAFIAYRNAYEIYESDYREFFNIKAPLQLKKDLVRMANKNGFYDSQEMYEEKFKLSYKEMVVAEKELIYFWHNGLGPIKDEWSINFIVIKGQGGLVVFENKELGLSFSFYTRSQEESNSLNDLRIVRVAFPKYSVRKNQLTGGAIEYNGQNYPLELLEDVDKIAIKSLNDRMMRELSKTLLRVALKQASIYAARQQENQNLATALTVLNAATEKADTRNWQTLPAKIQYARVPINQENSQISLLTYKGSHSFVEESESIVVKKKMGFKFFHSISAESLMIMGKPY